MRAASFDSGLLLLIAVAYFAMEAKATGGADAKAIDGAAAGAIDGTEPRREVKRYAINVKPLGRVHRLSDAAAQQPAAKRRAFCGWWVGSSVAIASFSASVGTERLCRKCFRGAAPPGGGGEDGDAIEEFA